MTVQQKRTTLLSILAICSLLLGFLLAKLDFFGFLTGEHAINGTYFSWIIITAYIATFCIFLLDFARLPSLRYIYIGLAGLYALTFFITTQSYLFTLVTALLYLGYIYYIYDNCQKKSALFIKFQPKEVLFPVMRDGLLFMLALFAAVSFFRAQERVVHQTLFAPVILQPISKPFVLGFNKELSSALKKQFGPTDPGRIITPLQREEIYIVLDATVDSMAKNNDNKVVGIDRDKIVMRKTTIYDDGSIDISPVVNSLLPDIGFELNKQLQQYTIVTPFIVALAIFLLLQPLTYPIHFIEKLVSSGLVGLLKRVEFIKIKKELREVDVVSL